MVVVVYSKGIANKWHISDLRVCDRIQTVIGKRCFSPLMEIFHCFIKPHVCLAVFIRNVNSSKVDFACITNSCSVVCSDHTNCIRSFNFHASISSIVVVFNVNPWLWLLEQLNRHSCMTC